MKILPLTYRQNPICYESSKNVSKEPLFCPNFVKPSSQNYYANFLVPFKSLKLREGENNFCDTGFFRDIETLSEAASFLKKNFPDGTEILDFAASNGEEAISLHALLNDNSNVQYPIFCYDKSKNVVNLAKKGVYTVYNRGSHDYWLLNDKCSEKFGPELYRAFNELMEETVKPDYDINDRDFVEHFANVFFDFKMKHYKIKDKYKENFEFNVGDIADIAKLPPYHKVGAVLFRNAFYIPTQNTALNEFELKIIEDINRQEIVDNIVDAIYEKLLPGGIFVMGNHEKEHIFLADDYTLDENRIFVPEYFSEIYKVSPVYAALSRDNRFSPIFKTKINSAIGSYCVSTIWKKNK